MDALTPSSRTRPALETPPAQQSQESASGKPSAPSFVQHLHQVNLAGQSASNTRFKPMTAHSTRPDERPISPKIRKVAQEFEAVFLAQMLAPMFENVGNNDLFGEEYANGVYKSMMVDQYANSISKAGGIGIARRIEAQLSQKIAP